MNSGIYILSLPIQSGKTTLLQYWLKTVTVPVAGFLSPDINGVRYLLNITTNELRKFQLPADAEGIKTGRFVFDAAVFEWGKNILTEALHTQNDWLIIDEVGRLEINEEKGWEPALGSTISYFQSSQPNKKLLLVIRDYLLDETIEKYQLHSATILSPAFFINKKPVVLNGLALCGGESTRMRRPKATLHYHKQPQFLHVARQLQYFCYAVYISANIELGNAERFEIIPDAIQYRHMGPIGGILSAISKYPDQSLMVLGCDYPQLKLRHLLQLFNAYTDEYEAMCFQHPESKFAEPMIAIYHYSCFEKMKSYSGSGGRSLQKFLSQINTKIIIPKEAGFLKSYDTPEDFLTFTKE